MQTQVQIKGILYSLWHYFKHSVSKGGQKRKILLSMTRSSLLRDGSFFFVVAEFSLCQKHWILLLLPSVCPKSKSLNKTSNNQPPRLAEASISLKWGKRHSFIKIIYLINWFWLKMKKKSIILNNILLRERLKFRNCLFYPFSIYSTNDLFYQIRDKRWDENINIKFNLSSSLSLNNRKMNPLIVFMQ